MNKRLVVLALFAIVSICKPHFLFSLEADDLDFPSYGKEPFSLNYDLNINNNHAIINIQFQFLEQFDDLGSMFRNFFPKNIKSLDANLKFSDKRLTPFLANLLLKAFQYAPKYKIVSISNVSFVKEAEASVIKLIGTNKIEKLSYIKNASIEFYSSFKQINNLSISNQGMPLLDGLINSLPKGLEIKSFIVKEYVISNSRSLSLICLFSREYIYNELIILTEMKSTDNASIKNAEECITFGIGQDEIYDEEGYNNCDPDVCDPDQFTIYNDKKVNLMLPEYFKTPQLNNLNSSRAHINFN